MDATRETEMAKAIGEASFYPEGHASAGGMKLGSYNQKRLLSAKNPDGMVRIRKEAFDNLASGNGVVTPEESPRVTFGDRPM